MEKFISWVEIPATDIHRAVDFYNSVLKADLQISDFGKEKMAGFPNGEGAISRAPGFKPSQQGAIVSFHVKEDVDSALERVKSNGGEVITEKTKIEAEGMGYFALFLDTEGNRVGLYGER